MRTKLELTGVALIAVLALVLTWSFNRTDILKSEIAVLEVQVAEAKEERKGLIAKAEDAEADAARMHLAGKAYREVTLSRRDVPVTELAELFKKYRPVVSNERLSFSMEKANSLYREFKACEGQLERVESEAMSLRRSIEYYKQGIAKGDIIIKGTEKIGDKRVKIEKRKRRKVLIGLSVLTAGIIATSEMAPN